MAKQTRSGMPSPIISRGHYGTSIRIRNYPRPRSRPGQMELRKVEEKIIHDGRACLEGEGRCVFVWNDGGREDPNKKRGETGRSDADKRNEIITAKKFRDKINILTRSTGTLFGPV